MDPRERTRLVVHVGANKTGSSAVQRFLTLNRRGLAEYGTIVPDDQLGLSGDGSAAQVFTFQQLLDHPEDGHGRLNAALDAIQEAHPRARTIVLSAENLAAHPAAPGLFVGLEQKFDIQIVLYIRRQDDYLLSSWQQWNSKIETDFWSWMVANVGVLGNWQAYLSRWAGVVPTNQITVRVFERAALTGGDVVQDFYSLLDLDVPIDKWQLATDSVNPSFSDTVMNLVRGNPLVFENVHDNDFYDFVRRFTGDTYLNHKRDSSITFKQREAILRRYHPSNQWVKENYLAEREGPLFKTPKEADYIERDSVGSVDAKLEFLTTLLYRMYKEQTQG